MPELISTLPILLIALWGLGTSLLIVWALHILATAPVLGDCQVCGEPSRSAICAPCQCVVEGAAAFREATQ